MITKSLIFIISIHLWALGCFASDLRSDVAKYQLAYEQSVIVVSEFYGLSLGEPKISGEVLEHILSKKYIGKPAEIAFALSTESLGVENFKSLNIKVEDKLIEYIFCFSLPGNDFWFCTIHFTVENVIKDVNIFESFR